MNYEPFPLSRLKLGKSAYVGRLDAEGAMGRRLLDLGLIPGTKVSCVAVSPFGDPAAYAIRGAVIALRRKDALGVSLVSAPERVAQLTEDAPSFAVL